MAGDKIYVEFVGPWKKIADSLTAKEWEKNFKREANAATKINALIIQRLIKAAIANAKVHGRGLSGLTAAIKGSTSPLIDHGDLMASVSHEIISPFEAHIGILRSAGEEMVNIAKIVHNGKTIRVSGKMRAMFAALHAVSAGRMSPADLRSGRADALWRRFSSSSPGDVWPTLDGVAKIVIPPRPFLSWALQSKEMTDKVLMNYVIAGIRAFIIPGVTTGVPRYIH